MVKWQPPRQDAPPDIESVEKLSLREFCRYSWIALKQVKPIGITICVAATVYVSLGGWPFPEGRHVSILGIFIVVAWFAIIEIKLKKAFGEAKQQQK